MKTFWLSFADPDLPKGSQFLGAIVIQAFSFPEAVALTHTMGINPGGEIASIECERVPPGRYHNRLLTKEDISAMEDEMGGPKGNVFRELFPERFPDAS